MEGDNTDTIRHFTNVEALYKILESGLKFSSGRSWSDKDDIFDVNTYKRITNKEIAVLCFCNGLGNLHHWAIHKRSKYSSKEQRIRCYISFYKAEFLEYISSIKIFEEPRLIKYCHDVEILSCNIADIPYLKKREYEIENELRIIYVGDKPDANAIIPNIIPFIKSIIISDRDCNREEFLWIKNEIENRYPQLKNKIDQKDTQWKKNIKLLIKK